MPSACPHCRVTLPGAAVPRACPSCGRSLASLITGPQLATTPLPAAAAPAEARVTIQLPDGTTNEHVLGEKTRIGRHPINTLKITDREISKEHAEIVRSGADFWLYDLNSSNGTFVNGRRVMRFKLKEGDEIALGGTTLVFHNGPRAAAPVQAAHGVTMVASLAPHVLASVRAEEHHTSEGFRPEREIGDVADLRRDYEKLRIANEFHRQVGLERDLPTLYDKILKVTFELMNADNGVILLFNAATGELKPDAVRRRRGDDVAISQTLLEQVVKTREGVLTQDAILDSRFSAAASIVAQGIRSAMAVPLISKNELRGVLYLDTRERAGAFTEKDLRLLSGIAAQAAVAIENSELARRIEQEAETRAHLSRFLSPQLVEQAQKGQLDLQKGGELCEITVLFADIRGFTSMTERAQPQEIVGLLNEHFELMVDEVFEYGGVLDKFIGDCIMALWGAPIKRADDAAQAVRAAVAMQETLAQWNMTRVQQGQKELFMGIGVNTGLAVVGNMGSSKRLEYTAIGDAVNTAARLCDVARAGQVVISEATMKRAGSGFEYEPLPAAKVKGKEHALTIFKVNGTVEKTGVR